MGSEHFDSRAATWDQDRSKIERAKRIADAVAGQVELGRGLRVLEYGAGTGLVSQALMDRVGPLTLVDTSAGMRKVMAEKIQAGELPEGTRVWDLDLEKQGVSEEQGASEKQGVSNKEGVPDEQGASEGQGVSAGTTIPTERFDLVVAALVLHHVRDLGPVLAGLTELLDAGGALCIADLDQEDGSFHAHHDDFQGHDGFDRAELGAAMEVAGLTDVTFTDCGSIEKDGTAYPVFLAVGRR